MHYGLDSSDEVEPAQAPRLPPAEKRRFVRRVFDRIARSYDAMNLLISLGQTSVWRARALSGLNLPPGSRVLDVGCGTGWVVRRLRAHYPGILVEGMDLSPNMIAQAYRRDPGGTYLVGDVGAIPHPDDTYDLVTTVFTLRNFPDLAAASREMLRVLRPGGLLVVLDTFPPEGAARAWRLWHRFWLSSVVPALVRPFADPTAYRYMAASIFAHVPVSRYVALLADLGASEVSTGSYSLGTATRVVARKPRVVRN